MNTSGSTALACALLFIGLSGSAKAADTTIYRDGEERVLPQATGTYVAPSTKTNPEVWTRQQRCTFEGGLLSNAAWIRDHSMSEDTARKKVHEVLDSNPKYSAGFRKTVDARISWVFEHPYYNGDSIQMAYSKECYPEAYAWYK